MDFYGSVSKSSCGIIIDGNRLEGLEKFKAWPSGVFAKTEFSMDPVNGKCTKSAVQRLSCNLKVLRQANDERRLQRGGAWVYLDRDRDFPSAPLSSSPCTFDTAACSVGHILSITVFEILYV